MRNTAVRPTRCYDFGILFLHYICFLTGYSMVNICTCNTCKMQAYDDIFVHEQKYHHKPAFYMFTSICRNHVILQNVVKCRLMMIFLFINTNQKKG